MSNNTLKPRLAGPATRTYDTERTSLYIHPSVRERMILLLWRPEMRAVGYSEFIDRAVDAAEAEIRSDTYWGRKRSDVTGGVLSPPGGQLEDQDDSQAAKPAETLSEAFRAYHEAMAEWQQAREQLNRLWNERAPHS